MTIPAGRELDLLVAEHVMGWKIHPCGTYEVDGSMSRHSTAFHPSTDIRHAWEVVERIPVDVLLRKGSPWCLCEILHGPIVTAETMPLAICRAALLAVGK